jgi:hypothetical protein
MKSEYFAICAWLVAIFCAGALMAGAPPPSMNAPDLATGPYSSMHMLLEKTFLKVDVATIDVRVDKPTQQKIAKLAGGQKYSDELGAKVADAAIRADNAIVQMKFERDVSLDRWMGVVRENLQQANAAGLISAALMNRVSQNLPNWFAVLKDRGYLKHDRLIYRVRPAALRTVVVAANGQVLLDRTDKGKAEARVILASYLAPGSEFRKPLVKSVFQ